MTTTNVILFGTVLLAAGVEILETAVIVLAVYRTHGARIALSGSGSAAILLAAAIAIGGVPAVHFIPLNILRVGFGVVMLWMGRKWLTKAVKRAVGMVAKRDEEANYSNALTALSAKERREGFSLAFRQTCLEGLEVSIVVVAMGSAGNRLALATVAAITAVVLVATGSILIAPTLRRIDENFVKMAGGIAMLAMGTFWLGEGFGWKWQPLSDGFIPVLVAIFAIATALTIRFLKSKEVTRNDNTDRTVREMATS